MKITIVERKIHASEELRDYTTKKVSKLERYFHKDTSAVVTFSEIKGRQTAEITVRHGGMVFRAEETTTDMFASVDGMISSIERQIRKNKTRLEKRLREGAFEKATANEAGISDSTTCVRYVSSAVSSTLPSRRTRSVRSGVSG